MALNAVGGRVSEDAGEENNDNKTYNPSLNTVRARPRITNPTGEGRSSSPERLVRPALSGRKALKKTSNRDSRGRQREGHSYRVDERLNTEHVVIREKEKQRPGKSGRRCRDGAQDRQERGSTESLSRSNSDIQLNSTLESGDGSNVHGRQTCLRSCSCECTSTNRAYLNRQSSRPALRSISSANGQSTSQTRSTPLSPQRPPSRTAAGDLENYSFSSSSEPDPFWVDVRSGAGTDLLSLNHHTQTHLPSLTTREIGGEGEEEVEEDEEVEDDVEEGSGVMEMMSQTMTSAASPPCISFGETGISKRERNRMKCLRRRQRRREKCRQSQLQESRQNSPGNPSTSSSEEDEDLGAGEREGYICAVCLDVYFSPYMCHPCNHIFCEPCLRTLAKNNPTNTPCPLCRTIITHVFFQKELNQSAKTFYPKEYLARKQNFQKASCAKWPLPSCRKLFRIFGGFQRQASPIARHQLPHGGGYRLNGMDFGDDTRGWHFDMNMVIIYIFSVNWVIGFFILFFICYLFFFSF